MKFDDFVNTPRTLAMVVTVEEYIGSKPLLQDIYCAEDIEPIDDFCLCKPRSESYQHQMRLRQATAG